MIFKIRLSCVLVVLLSLESSIGSRGRTRVQDRQRLQDLQNLSKRTNNSNDHLRITNEVVQIYKKYRHREVAARGSEEKRLDIGVRDFESKVVLVNGEPRQGGPFWKTANQEVFQNAQDQFKTSSKNLVDGITNYLLNELVQSMSVSSMSMESRNAAMSPRKQL